MKNCLLKAEYSCKFACNSAIKFSTEKEKRQKFEEIKNGILKERERILENLHENTILKEKIFEDIIEEIFKLLASNKNINFLKKETIDIIKETNKKIIDII